VVRCTLVLGDTNRDALREALRGRGVRTNAYFDALWPHVAVAAEPRVLEVVIATGAELGLPDGATLDELLDHVAAQGLGVCPLEAAARLRLALDAVPGSGRITVVSPRALPDEATPRGLYLRDDDDGVWLRAFVASDDWRFDAEERFALAVVGGSIDLAQHTKLRDGPGAGCDKGPSGGRMARRSFYGGFERAVGSD